MIHNIIDLLIKLLLMKHSLEILVIQLSNIVKNKIVYIDNY